MHKFDRMLEKKKKEGGKELSSNEKTAKMSVVQALRDFAAGEMGKKIDGMKKVSVASDSEEGLEKGLDKAKELIGKPDKDVASEDQYDETEESDQEEESEKERGVDQHPAEFADTPHGDYSNGDESDSDEDSEEELDAKLKHLMALKQKFKK